MSFINFDDWREAVRADQRERIERLRAVAQDHDPHGIIHRYLSDAQNAWYADPAEAERCIELAIEQLNREREWESEAIIKTSRKR